MTTKVWGSLLGDGCNSMLGLYGKQQYHPLCTGDCGVTSIKLLGGGLMVASKRSGALRSCRPGRVAAPQCGSKSNDLCCVRVMIQRLLMLRRGH